MSELKDRFVAAARRRDFANAYLCANGLNMQEMLAGLATLGPVARDMEAQSSAAAGVNLPRITWAMQVVKTGRLPPVAPGDLATTGQVEVAKRYLQGLKPATPSGELSPYLSALVAALDSGRLNAKMNNVAGQLRALHASGEWVDGAGRRFRASRNLLAMLAALVDGGNLTIMSLFRFGQGPHGEVQPDGSALGRAVDIMVYQSMPINLITPANAPNAINGVAGVISNLPAGNYTLGLPRPGGGPRLDPTQDVFIPVTSLSQVSHSPTGSFRGDLARVLEPAKTALTRAADANAQARIRFMYPDGVDHVHVKAEG